MSNSAPGLWLPNGGKGYGIVLGAPGDRRVVTRWCAFAPKVDSCGKPPAAWAIKRLGGFASTCGNLLARAL